tara:strand:+ start:768 stop:4892 length:4125 start_codon:yes stop_codon:yes gene_type:complete
MPEIKNNFLKGRMNQDSDSRILQAGEYREAINLMISRSEGSTVGEFENLLGNTSISILGYNNEAVIGHYVNESANKVFLFATDYNNVNGVRNTSGENYIYELDLFAPYTKKVLVTGGFLNFNQSFPINGVNLVEDLLFWTDNLNQPRKINITLANPANAPTPTHYTTEDQISVAKYAPCEPIYLMDRVLARFNGAVNNSANIIVDDATGVEIGDLITPFDAYIDSTPEWSSFIYVIKIDGDNLVLSKAITVADGIKVIFERTTTTQKTEINMSNGYSGAVNGAPPSTTSFKIVYPSTEIEYDGNTTARYSDMLPRLGDFITGPSKTIADNLTVVAAAANHNGGGVEWTITTSAVHGFVDTDSVTISANPNYDSSWKGDPVFLEDKFIRFSYRFKFEDNEYSLMAPFTQPVFIPKQYSEFGGGQFPEAIDMDNAYKSTIVAWFENNIQNIILKIPMPESTAALNMTNLLITDVDILYKESDANAVKVLDTIDLINFPTGTLPFMEFYDGIHGANTNVYYYSYDYNSSKPYKTLPSNQTVRVYDKVPVKALSQEIIGNRIVYGNYIDKHTSPAPLNFSAEIATKKPYYNNITQSPYQTLKQSRTYQVGIILVDRYGRQSDVILSAYDDVAGQQGSTIFSQYNTYSYQVNNPVIDWVGDALNVQFDTAIGTGTSQGEPGVWHATTNPLGWYSYKVVVKQQEQEYYNVYLPGWVNGLPITESKDRNQIAYSILLSDNINKVPRNLSEVGPTDKEYTSSERLYLRVNNPIINNKTSNRPYGIPQENSPWNKQYYPNALSQKVMSIATVRDMELSGIPFVVSAPEGPYGQIGTIENPSGTIKPIAIGSIPWGTSPIAQPFYNSDLDPFALKIDTVANSNAWTLTSVIPTVPGPIGATCNIAAAGSAATSLKSMEPCLSVAETKPTFSRLELFYETSLQGKIATLNSLINAQYPGVVSLNNTSADFVESLAPAGQIGTNIVFKTGDGNSITNNSLFRNAASQAVVPKILSAYRANDINQTTDVSNLFQFVYSTTDAEYQLKSAAATYFTYTGSSEANPSNDVYNITFETVYTPTNPGTDPTYTNTTTYTATLTNVAPTITNCSNPSGITIATTTIKTFTGTNGTNASNSAANKILGLVFDLDPSNAASILNGFTMTSTGVLTANSGTLVDQSTYTIKPRLRDVDGNGLDESPDCSITFTVGTQHVPRAICYGKLGADVATCTESFEAFFGASNATTSTGTYGTIGGTYYPGDDIKFYNVRANAAAGSTTGALTQGVMYIKPYLTTTATGSVTCNVSIQYRADANSSWTQAVDTTGAVINNLTISASNGVPGFIVKNFNVAGEYRAFTNNVSGEGCPGNNTALEIRFGDTTYGTTDCTLGPL